MARRFFMSEIPLFFCKLSIWEIAGSVGYNNQSKFAAMFREKTSVTPTEYRRLYNNKDIINTKEDY